MSGPLYSKLAATRRRMRAVVALGGLCLGFAGLVAASLVSYHTDRLFVFGSQGRLAWLVFLLCGVAVVVIGLVLVPLARRLPDEDVAAAVERRYPVLRERLLTTVELARAGAVAGVSAGLAAQLADQTERLALPLSFPSAVSLGRLRGPTLCAAAAAALLLGHLALIPGAMGVWLRRILFPSADIPVYARTQVWVSPDDQFVPRGESVTLTVKVGGRLSDSAVLHYRFDGAPWTMARLQHPLVRREPDGEYGKFSFRLADLQQDVAYYATANDGRSNPHALHVEDRPTILSVRLNLAYPPYTHRRPETIVATAGNVVAPVGTRVEVTATASKSLDRATFVRDGTPRGRWAVSGDEISGRLTVVGDETWGLRLRDRRGFDDLAPPQYTIRAQPDLPPTVQVLVPGADVERTPGGSMALRVAARDDYGVTGMGLVYHVGPRQGTVALPAGGGMPQVAVTGRWNLAALGLKAGNVVAYEAIARDNDDVAGPHTGRSASYRIRIVGTAEMAERLDIQTQQEVDALRRLIQRQSEARSQLEQARATARPEAAAQARATQDSVARDTADLAQRMAQTTQQMRDNNLGTPTEAQRRDAAQQELSRLAQPEMPRAAADIGRGRLGEAAQRERTIQEALQRIADEVSPAPDTSELAARADHLAEEQQRLADQSDVAAERMGDRTVAQATPQERASMNALAQQQADLRERTQALQQDVARAARDATEQGQPNAGTLQRTAQQLGQSSPARRQAAASASLRAAAPAAASPAQNQAAEMLRQAAATLDPTGQAQRDAASLARQANALDRLSDRLQQMASQEQGIEREAQQSPGQDAMRRLAQQQQGLQGQTQQAERQLSSVPAAAQSAGKAATSMSRAAAQLSQSASQQAAGSAHEAARQLLQAAQEANEASRQLQLASQAKDAQARVEDLARQQRTLQGQTRQLDASKPSGPNPPQEAQQQYQRRANAMAQSQNALQQRLQSNMNEMPSEAFRWAMREAGQRMGWAAQGLWQRDAGTSTQRHQEHAAQTLERIARALGRGAEAHEQSAQGAAPSGAEQAGADNLDQMQLVREMQAQIRQETAGIDEQRQRSASHALTPEQQRDLNYLTSSQRETRSLTRRIADQMRPTGGAAVKPLDQAGQEMEGVQEMLLRQQTDSPTQERQDKIVRMLDQAIGQTRQAMQQQRQQLAQQQNGQQQTSPRFQPGREGRKSDKPPVVQAQAGPFGSASQRGRGFGGLSPRAVESLRQGQQERVPAEYRDLVNQYYRALSERSR